jgi:cell division protein FtsI (penicillin-binding protein 3)
MGYEVAVTPLQLAVAYSVFANGGLLLEPTLVKEVQTPDGQVQYRHEPRVVRRVIPEEVSHQIRDMLVEVVEAGTAADAGMDVYTLAGKTGTPRGTVNGKYVTGLYNPNFVGLFPAEDPQYVIAVRLSNPSAGSIYGGKAAAPVTRQVIEAAIALPRAALDRVRLAATARPTSRPRGTPATLRVSSTAEQAGETLATRPAAESAPEPVIVALPAGLPQAPKRESPRTVPDVRGMSVREAVRTLHSAGFRVEYASGRGISRTPALTQPAAGSVVRQGTLIRLILSP